MDWVRRFYFHVEYLKIDRDEFPGKLRGVYNVTFHISHILSPEIITASNITVSAPSASGRPFAPGHFTEAEEEPVPYHLW